MPDSKIAAKHLACGLAIELSPKIYVTKLVSATIVYVNTMFSYGHIISSHVIYNAAFSENEDTETLRDKLAGFYAKRSLTQYPVEIKDQTEAAYLSVSPTLPKTTEQIISIFCGHQETFLS